MTSSRHYQAPETLHPIGAAYGGLAVLASMLLLAPIYAYAIVYIPFIYINLILTGVFGVLTGVGIAMAMRAGKMHHIGASYLFVVGGAFMVYWMHWVWWFSALAFRGDVEDFSVLPFLFPPVLFEAIGSTYEYGTWSMRDGDAVTGVMLAIVWLVEFAIYAGAALFGAAMFIGTGTFCPRCATWCKAGPVRRVQLDPTGELARALNEGGGDPGALIARPPPSGASTWHELSVESCDKCHQTYTLTMKDVTMSTDAKGNQQRKEKVTVDRLYVTGEQAATLN